jgi:hypothetical protein
VEDRGEGGYLRAGKETMEHCFVVTTPRARGFNLLDETEAVPYGDGITNKFQIGVA